MTKPLGPNTSRKAREAQERLMASKALVLPNDHNPQQLWLLVRQDPADGRQGSFFVTHGANWAKFNKRKGFQVLAHSYDPAALRAEARAATLSCGPAYQPPFSAHQSSLPPEPDPMAPEALPDQPAFPPTSN